MRKLLVFALLLNAALLAGRFWQELPAIAQEKPVATENGDVNGDGDRNITDAVYLLRWLFQRGPEPVVCAQETGGLTPEQAEILRHMRIVELPMGQDAEGKSLGTAKTIRFTDVNVQIVNGLGATDGPPKEGSAGLGNLIVGYNESRLLHRICVDNPDAPFCQDIRTGSHNIVVGFGQNYSSFGGLVVGAGNTISGRYSSVSGGARNTASSDVSSVSGGSNNAASGGGSSVSGGDGNEASGDVSSVSGCRENTARVRFSSVSGGARNTAIGSSSSVSGGTNNTASSSGSSVSGGLGNEASGAWSSVSGGGGSEIFQGNTAEGDFSTVSGGRNVTATGEAEHAP